MTIHSVLRENAYDLAIAPQNAMATEGTVWEWIDASALSIEELVVETEPNGPMLSRGAGVHTLRGRRWWSIKFRVPAHGQPTAYDYTNDVPGFLGAMQMFYRALLGASGTLESEIQYAAADVSPVDGNTVNCVTSPGSTSPGSLLAYGAAGVVTGCGWIEGITHPGTPYVVQLREDVGVVPGSGVARYPTWSVSPSKSAPRYYSIRVVGDDDAQDFRFIGGAVNAVRLKLEGDILFLEYDLICYGGHNFPGTGGGLDRVHTSYLALEPMLGRGGARVTLGSNVSGSSLDDATADPNGSDDIRDLQWSFEFPHDPIWNPSGPESVSGVRIGSPKITASLWVPRCDVYVDGSLDMIEAARENRTPLSLNMYMGDTAGRLFALGMPRGLVKSAKPAFNGGTWGTSLTLQAGVNDGDGDGTLCGDKVSVAAVG